jgi:nucleotide-binding universal stress UspA family protein
MDSGEERRILLATDFSPPADLAYAYAAGMARALPAGMLILNVLEGPPGLDPAFPVNTVFLKQIQEESDRELAKISRVAEKDGIVCVTRQVYGRPAEGVARVAEEARTTLIVMGTHGRTGWDRLLLGSAAEAVVREAPCPVLTVRMSPKAAVADIPGSVKIDQVLVPLDFSEFAQEAFEYAAMLAKQFGAKVLLVHAVEAAAYPLDFALFGVSEAAALRGRIQVRLHELMSVLKADGVEAEVVCETGTAAEVIVKEAGRFPPGAKGAIVMGTHGRRGLNRLALGSVAEYVVRHAACPVFTVKSPRYRYGITREVRDATQKI